jgi:hypothetical protein
MAEIPNPIRLIQHGAAHTATDMRARLAIRLKEIYPFHKQVSMAYQHITSSIDGMSIKTAARLCLSSAPKHLDMIHIVIYILAVSIKYRR